MAQLENSKQILGPKDPLTIEIYNFIKSRLELPENIISVSLHLELDNTVQIDCKFHAYPKK